MAKLITGKWQDALKMLSQCRIEESPVLISPDKLALLLKDPVGQVFVLQITARPKLGLSGNVVVANGEFVIECLELELGDRFGDFMVGGHSEP